MKLDTFKLVKLGPVDDSNDTNMVTLMYRNLVSKKISLNNQNLVIYM